MYRKIRKLVISMLFALSILISGAAVVSMSDMQVSADVVWDSVSIETSYAKGQEFVVPNRVLTVDGQSIQADSTVIFPDGTTTISKNVDLKMAGVYTIKYTAYLNGKIYSANDETFVVKYISIF